MNEIVNLMLVCEILYYKHKIFLYDNHHWNSARRAVAKNFEIDAGIFINALFLDLREEIALRAKTFSSQLEVSSRLNKDIEDMKKFDLATLKKMVSDFQT